MFTLDTTPPVTTLTSAVQPYLGSARSVALNWSVTDTQAVRSPALAATGAVWRRSDRSAAAPAGL